MIVKVILCFVLLTTSVSGAHTGSGKLSIYESNPHYFQSANGTPIYIIGYYQFWFGRAAYDSINNQIIDRLSENKINYVRILPDLYIFDGKKWDISQFDEKKSSSLKSFISYADSKGIYVHISLFNGAGLKANRWANQIWNIDNNINGNSIGNLDRNNDGDASDLNEFYDYNALIGATSDKNRLNTADVQRLYLDKILLETSNFSNVFYEIGNEVTGSHDWIKYWVDYIKARTDNLITVDKDFAIGFDPLTEPNVDGTTYHQAAVSGNSLSSAWDSNAYSYNRWIGADTDGNTLMYRDPDRNRKSAWIAFADGGHWLNYDENFPTNGSINYAKATYFKYLQNFISNIPFWNMIPHDELATSGHVFADPAEEFVIYLISGGSTTVNLSASSGTLYIEWYNPRTGTYQDKTIVWGGASRTFTAPDSNDWVLHIISTPTAFFQYLLRHLGLYS